jgi:hypothetical protein
VFLDRYFLNDFFYFITDVRINAYADDQKMFDFDINQEGLKNRINKALETAVTWFKRN